MAGTREDRDGLPFYCVFFCANQIWNHGMILLWEQVKEICFENWLICFKHEIVWHGIKY